VEKKSKSKSKKGKLAYEDCFSQIDEELVKRRGTWFLHSLTWMDYDDVCQIIRSHIHKKWDLWDQERALAPWINKIITNQIKNILRNNYSNFVKPCVNCPFNQSSGEEGASGLCGFTKSGTQDNSCPLYKKWEKTKKSAYDIKMALTLEHHSQEVFKQPSDDVPIEEAESRLHKEMKKVLNERQYKIYSLLFIYHREEEDVAKEMGYKTTEKGRKAGYKQIKNLKKLFREKAEKILKTKDVFLHSDATHY
jgi:DNA-directed RNA polymerase specialized sigma24 family protein